VEKLIMEKLDRLKLEIEQAIEGGAIKILEQQIKDQEALVWAAAEQGCKEYLRQLQADLDLTGNPTCSLAMLVEKCLAQDTIDGEDIQEIERLKVSYVKQQAEQFEEEHRHLTLALARPGASERQKAVLETECRRIEGRLAILEKHLSPLKEQQEQLQREYQELLDRHAEAVKALKRGENRVKGAALAKVFAKVLLHFGWQNEGHVGRGRHGRTISVWLPEKTGFVYTVEGAFQEFQQNPGTAVLAELEGVQVAMYVNPAQQVQAIDGVTSITPLEQFNSEGPAGH